METLNTLFESFETGIRSGRTVKPKEYLKSIGLSYNDLRIGFNSGQFHHGVTQEVKEQFEALGVIKKKPYCGGKQKRYNRLFDIWTIRNHFSADGHRK